MMIALLLLMSLLAVVNSKTPLFSRSSVPTGWSMTQVASPNSPVQFHVALTQRNLDVLERIFNEVSDPRHEEYTNYRSIEEIAEIVKPDDASRMTVLNWLHLSGINKVNDFVDSIEAFTTVQVASKMFDTDFYEFLHNETGKVVVKAFGTVSVPQEVHDVIDMVLGLSSFPVPHYVSQHPFPPWELEAILPQTVWQLYSMPNSTESGSSQISQGVIEWEEMSFDPIDLANFSKEVDVQFPLVDSAHIVGTNFPDKPQIEGSLDIQFLASVNPGAQNWYWMESSGSWLYGFAVHFLNTTEVPDVISISYAWWEGGHCDLPIVGEECQKLNVTSTGYVQRVNTEFQKMGVRGVSIFVGSGDSGAHTRFDPYCQQNRTLAEFPGSSPYVTSVGATQVDSETFFEPSFAPICQNKLYNFSCVKTGRERAVNMSISYLSSGGGFSNVSRRLAYQEDVVQAYLKQTDSLPPLDYFNHSGRAYPDVSAVGNNGFILNGGVGMLVGGTSMSAPTFAGVASMLANVFKLKTGKALGFMNPLLYQAYAVDPTVFNDITVGDNICTEFCCANICTDSCCKSCKGFKTAPGYDAVTGLGR